jgi:hypothetical protein
MDNLGELLINAVIARKPKMLSGLNQNGKWSGLEVTSSSNVDIRTTGEKASPNPFGYLCGTWKPRNLPLRKGKQTVRRAEKVAGIGKRKKRMPCCNGKDKG